MRKLKIAILGIIVRFMFFLFGKYKNYITMNNNEALMSLCKKTKFVQAKRKSDGLNVIIFKINEFEFLHINCDALLKYEHIVSNIAQSYWIGYLAGKEGKEIE